MKVVLPSDAKRWAALRAISRACMGCAEENTGALTTGVLSLAAFDWGLHKLREQVLMTPVAIEHRPHGQNDGRSDILSASVVTGRVQKGCKSYVSTLRSCGSLKICSYKNES